MLTRLKLLFSIFIVVLFSITACKSHVAVNSEPRLQIAEGGGFTGAMDIYVVHPNGQVFKKGMGDTGFIEIKSIRKNTAQKLFDEAGKILTTENQVNEPDNIYRSILLIEKDSNKEAVWHLNRPELDNLYEMILNAILEVNGTKD